MEGRRDGGAGRVTESTPARRRPEVEAGGGVSRIERRREKGDAYSPERKGGDGWSRRRATQQEAALLVGQPRTFPNSMEGEKHVGEGVPTDGAPN